VGLQRRCWADHRSPIIPVPPQTPLIIATRGLQIRQEVYMLQVVAKQLRVAENCNSTYADCGNEIFLITKNPSHKHGDDIIDADLKKM